MPPADYGVYAYTYFDGLGYPLYHGYTTNARQRAGDHFKKAPWASWAEDVRYRKCSTVHSARRLESRLQRMIPSLCHASGRTRTYHGEDWSDIDCETKINHVTGHCRLPGGVCDADEIARRVENVLDGAS